MTPDKPSNKLELSTQEHILDTKQGHHSQVPSLVDKTEIADGNRSISSKQFWFAAAFAGYMDMYGDLETVARYFQAHEGWFCRCAQPMKVEPLNENGYILNVGRFASLGYEVEPKIAVVLDPPQDNLYVMRTVPIPNYEAPGYEVQYKSMMELAEVSGEKIIEPSFKKLFVKKSVIPATITKVSWQLSITVTVEFPKFIEKLPATLIQKSGDRFLAGIISQISPRLTYKVQQDFHTSRGLSIPPKSGRGFTEMAKECNCAVDLSSDDNGVELSHNNSQDDNYVARGKV